MLHFLLNSREEITKCINNLFLILILSIISLNLFSQEIFQEDEDIKSCIINIPLPEKPEDQLKYQQKYLKVSNEYRDQELIIVEISKKTNEIYSIDRVFFIVDYVDKTIRIFIVPVEKAKSDTVFSISLNPYKYWYRFYLADCYDPVIKLRITLSQDKGEIICSELSIREDLAYQRSETKPFTGVCYNYNFQGGKSEAITYENGKKVLKTSFLEGRWKLERIPPKIGKSGEIESPHYKIERKNIPIPLFGRYMTGTIKRSELDKVDSILINDSDKEINYSVTQFSFLYQPKDGSVKFEKGSGPRLTDVMKAYLSNPQKGDMIIITEIQVMAPGISIHKIQDSITLIVK